MARAAEAKAKANGMDFVTTVPVVADATKAAVETFLVAAEDSLAHHSASTEWEEALPVPEVFHKVTAKLAAARTQITETHQPISQTAAQCVART